jgi:hypothetical protein
MAGGWGEYLAFGTPTSSLAVHVAGDQLVNGAGTPIRLLGVDVSGTEDACSEDSGLSWGSSNTIAEDEATAAAMLTWHINAVRVLLNEDCWLAINGVPVAYSGTTYQTAIMNWVNALNNAGIIAILDLQITAPGTYEAVDQQWPMADADHSITFWTQVATDYKSDPAVIFDLYSEPFIGLETPAATDWSCWLNGCSTSFSPTVDGVVEPAANYTTAGMQQLVNAVRATGAAQPLMIGGLNWSGDPCGIEDSDGNGGVCIETADMPTDPLNQLIISFHTYNWTACTTTSCWNTVAQAAEAANLPIVTGELGENDCTDSYVNSYMNWADQNNVSYTAFEWDINYNTPSSVSPTAADYETHLIQENP